MTLFRFLRANLGDKLFLDIGQNVATSAALLAITVVTTPLMTRLFPPEVYGINGMMVRAATLLSAVGLLGLPVALSREHGQGEQTRLLAASLAMGVVVTILSLSGFLILPRLIPGISGTVVAVFPIMVFIYCLNLTVQAWVTANGLFPQMAKGRLSDGLVARGLALLVGATVHAGAMSMLLADLAGKSLGIFVVLKASVGVRRTSLRGRSIRLTATVGKYRDFATYANLATILPVLAAFIVDAAIASWYGIDNAGQYILATSILNLPVMLISLAAAPVIFHHLSEVADQPEGRPGRFCFLAFLGFAGAGAVCMTPIMFYGPELFVFFFGQHWRMAGHIAQVLAVPMIFNFSYVALLSLFRAQKRIKFWMLSEICSLSMFAIIFFYEPADMLSFFYILATAYGLRFAIIHFGFIASIRMEGSLG